MSRRHRPFIPEVETLEVLAPDGAHSILIEQHAREMLRKRERSPRLLRVLDKKGEPRSDGIRCYRVRAVLIPKGQG